MSVRHLRLQKRTGIGIIRKMLSSRTPLVFQRISFITSILEFLLDSLSALLELRFVNSYFSEAIHSYCDLTAIAAHLHCAPVFRSAAQQYAASSQGAQVAVTGSFPCAKDIFILRFCILSPVPKCFRPKFTFAGGSDRSPPPSSQTDDDSNADSNDSSTALPDALRRHQSLKIEEQSDRLKLVDVSWILQCLFERGGLDPNLMIPRYEYPADGMRYPPASLFRPRLQFSPYPRRCGGNDDHDAEHNCRPIFVPMLTEAISGFDHEDDEHSSDVVKLQLMHSSFSKLQQHIVHMLLTRRACIHGGGGGAPADRAALANPLLVAIMKGEAKMISQLFHWASVMDSEVARPHRGREKDVSSGGGSRRQGEQEQQTPSTLLVERALQAAAESAAMTDGGSLLHFADLSFSEHIGSSKRRSCYARTLRALLENSQTVRNQIDAPDNGGFTPLMYASLMDVDNDDVENDDDDDVENDDGDWRASEEVTALLLSYGANPAVQNSKDSGRSALLMAAQNGNERIVAVILRSVVERNRAFHHLEKRGGDDRGSGCDCNNSTSVNVQQRHSSCIDSKDDDDDDDEESIFVPPSPLPPLDDAAAQRIINQVSHDGASALHCALRNKHASTALLFLSNDTMPDGCLDINLQDSSSGLTPLHYAVSNLVIPFLEKLVTEEGQRKLLPLEHNQQQLQKQQQRGKVLVDVPDVSFRTPIGKLATAMMKQVPSGNSCFRQRKSSSSSVSRSDATAEQSRVLRDGLRATQILLQLGASCDTAHLFAMCAIDSGCDILELCLKQWNVDVNATWRSASDTRTLLMAAAEANAETIVRKLLSEFGADSTIRDSFGNRAEEQAGVDNSIAELIKNWRKHGRFENDVSNAIDSTSCTKQ